jgi:hypothetical protein
VIVKKGEKDLPGLTDEEKPRMRGPKRASKVGAGMHTQLTNSAQRRGGGAAALGFFGGGGGAAALGCLGGVLRMCSCSCIVLWLHLAHA